MRLGSAMAAAGLLALTACGDDKKKSQAVDEGGETSGAKAADPSLETSRPSEATADALRQAGPIEVLLFFPPGPIADQVVGYFGELASKVDRAPAVREIDRVMEPALAKKHRVQADGTIVLVTDAGGPGGDNSEQIAIPTQPRRARLTLPELDNRVGAKLKRLAATRRAILWTPAPADGKPPASYSALTRLLKGAGFEVDATTDDPDAATLRASDLVVYIDGGARPMGDASKRLAEKVEAGGAVMVALEPEEDTSLGALGELVGVRYDPTPVADDKTYVKTTGGAVDRANLITDEVTDHATTTTATRAGKRAGGLAFLGAGSFEAAGKEELAGDFTVHSRSSAFRDDDGDYVFDADDEERAELALAGAFSPAGTEGRAVLFADATWIDDRVIRQLALNQALLADAIRWLPGEEAFAAEPTPGAAKPETTTYPLRPDRKPPAAGTLWEVTPDSIARIEYRTDEMRITLERPDGGGELRGTDERFAGGGWKKRFALSPQGEKLVERIASLTFVRELGPIGEEARPDFGLGPKSGTLALKTSKKRHELRVGDPVLGQDHRYALDPESGVAYVLSGAPIRLLEGGAVRLGRRDER